MMGLFMALVINILITGMAFERLVSSTTDNAEDIVSIRAVDVQLMHSINEMTRAVAALTATVGHLAEDIEKAEEALIRLEQ